MRKHVHVVLAGMLGGLVAAGLGCDGGGGGSGGGGDIQVRPAQDGEFVGFLWKPRSESNGNLVVLLPEEYAGNPPVVSIHRTRSRSAESLIEPGRFAGVANGNRPHYRFNAGGGAYGNAWVVAETTGGAVAWEIPNGAQRWD